MRIYHAGLYIRTSVFNGGKKDGGTIKNQEILLRNYIAAKPDFMLTSVYIDNGESGVNFNRSNFKHLIEDVRTGKIDCIIVKDLSRFGRNYIETGEYLEHVFPFLGVRFIAINDGYDSIQPDAAELLKIHLKNLVNDVYARDISRKICPVLQMKQWRGEFLGTWAPYGYRKDEKDRHKLVVDEETAPIVRTMFYWRLEGWTYQKIVQQLNTWEIPSPSRYRYQKGIIKDKKLAEAIWKSTTVIRILANQVYLGHMIQGKKRAALWNNQAQATVSEKDWIIVPDTHMAIVDKEIFEAVQEVSNNTNQKGYG